MDYSRRVRGLTRFDKERASGAMYNLWKKHDQLKEFEMQQFQKRERKIKLNMR